MDRERLQQVQQSDLSESRVNEDFVNWIKTSGPWYLLAVLIGIAVYMYIVNIQRAELRAREQAWFDFSEAVMPASLEDVAAASRTSPLAAELRAASTGEGSGALSGELSSMAPGERKRAMERVVAEALATVLSLGDRERAALDLDRPLDQLGLRAR